MLNAVCVWTYTTLQLMCSVARAVCVIRELRGLYIAVMYVCVTGFELRHRWSLWTSLRLLTGDSIDRPLTPSVCLSVCLSREFTTSHVGMRCAELFGWWLLNAVEAWNGNVREDARQPRRHISLLREYNYTATVQLLYGRSNLLTGHILSGLVDSSVWYFSMPSVIWRCWLGGRKGIRSVKNWVVGCWCGCVFGSRCRFAYGPADATATHCLLLQ